MYREIENEVAELSNSLHLLKAYENQEGNLDFEQIVDDKDFGTYDSLNEVYIAARNLIQKITALN